MSNKAKYIFSYLLIAVALAIFSHSIIPHDHHKDILDELSHQHEEQHSGKQDAHCHYLNNILVNKIQTETKKTQNNKPNSNYISAGNVVFLCNTKTNFLVTNLNRQNQYNKLKQLKLLLKNTPLRGSPYSV